MVDRIKKLSIDGFRGASKPLELAFKDKPVTLIFGENGTGKSTIVDALECVGSGSTAFLDDWKLGKGRRKESYIPTLGKDVSDVSIQIDYGEQTYKATLNKKGLSLCNTPERPRIKVLRRKSLQAFIEADPAERYREVANFLDIPQIEISEQSLRQAYKDAKDKFTFASKAVEQAKESLQGIWEAEGSPTEEGKYKNAEIWARDQAHADSKNIESELEQLRNGLKITSDLERSVQSYQTAVEVIKDANIKLESAEKQLKEIEASATQGNAELVSLLQDAKSYLSKNPDELCPVCEETEIDAEQLVKRLDQRLSGMDKLRKASDVKIRTAKKQETAAAQLQQAESGLLDETEKILNIFSKQLSKFSDFTEIKKGNREKAIQMALEIQQAVKPVEQDFQTRQQQLQKQLSNLKMIRQQVETLDSKTTDAEQGEKLQQRLQQALGIVENKRKAYVEKVLLNIGQSVDELYQQIHPDEDIGKLKLKLDENQRGSLLYGVVFATEQDIHPQPYYSESHLDTLGLCIFLALAKRNSNNSAVVVLDDVLVSVDQQHLKRSIDMIINQSSNFSKIIVTSHYRPLRNRFTNSRTGSSNVHLIDLRQWHLDKGISFTSPKLAIQELADLFENEYIPRSQLAIDAGRMLENIFDYITLLYGTRMTRKPEPLYTLNELFSSVRGIKGWKILEGQTETEIKPLLDTIGENLPVRNEAGAHYNENGELLSDDEIVSFAKAALDLAKALACSSCNGMPERQGKQAGNWACQCKITRMLPFQI